MAINEDLFEFDEEELNNPTTIKVVGVGGGGNNAVTRMKEAGVKGVDFIAVNTDAQDLNQAAADMKLHIGEDRTNGLGAGADPNVGLNAAKENREEIRDSIEDTDLLFITAGMGGGTGTGAAPVIADMAKEEMGILTIGVVTRPFDYEGKVRKKNAQAGIKQLRKSVDTLIIVPNQRLFQVIEDDTPFLEAFKIVDEVLYQGVQGISELITEEGEINLDFADVKTVMSEQGDALMGIGEDSGEEAAVDAAREALNCPLLETNDIEGASSVIVNIMGGPQISMKEVEKAIKLVREKTAADANVIAGQTLRSDLENEVRVTVIATGFPAGSESKSRSSRPGDKVYDIRSVSEDELDKPPSERRQQEASGVDVVNEEPQQSDDDDEDDDLSIPTFMRVQ
ncbi:MAG: cell division protein FtsZ [bacterium]